MLHADCRAGPRPLSLFAAGTQRHSSSGGSALLTSPGSDRLRELQQYLSSGQQQVVTNLLRVRALVKASRARMEQQRTHEFLNACSAGNLEHMRAVSVGLGSLCMADAWLLVLVGGAWWC